MKNSGFVAVLSVLFVLSSPNRALSVNKESEKEFRQYRLEMEVYIVEMHERLKDTYAELPKGNHDRSNIPIPPFIHDSDGKRGSKPRLMMMYRLVDYLKLDEETATRFFPAYLEHVKSRYNLIKEHRELIKKIVEDADNDLVAIKDLRNNVEMLRKNEKLMEKELNSFLDKSKKILDERQYIKLIVFNDKLKEDLFMKFRERKSSKEEQKSSKEEPKLFREIK